MSAALLKVILRELAVLSLTVMATAAGFETDAAKVLTTKASDFTPATLFSLMASI